MRDMAAFQGLGCKQGMDHGSKNVRASGAWE
jgi:hypothetical protein